MEGLISMSPRHNIHLERFFFQIPCMKNYGGKPMPYSSQLIQFLLISNREQIEEYIEDIHPADILDALHHYAGDKIKILNKLPENIIVAIIDHAEDEEKYELLTIFLENKQREIVKEMSSDELVDLLGSISEEEKNNIIVKMDVEDAKEVKELLT